MSEVAVADVVQLHIEEAALLRHTRSTLLRAAHIDLPLLRRSDERLAAHLDGASVAGDFGWSLAQAALAEPGAGSVFTATVLAIGAQQAGGLDALIELSRAAPDAQRGLLSAFGWASASDLRGLTRTLLASGDAWRLEIGLAACAMHGVDAGPVLAAALARPEPALRCRALAAAASLGRVDLLPACQALLAETDTTLRFHAARAALLLGDRDAALRVLEPLAFGDGACRRAALDLLLMALPVTEGNALLKKVARSASLPRLLVEAIASVGDPHYVPWLIRQMDDAGLARVAGETFSQITGLDLVALELARPAPADAAPDPIDDPAETALAMDADDSLPWPDAGPIAAWWQANGAAFVPGTRYFAGAPPQAGHCTEVLRNGRQRQRRAAAHWLCLLQPGTSLFNTCAPAWRQQRLLAAAPR